MAYVLLDKDGVIVQKQPNKQKGFIKAPDDVVCGMVQQGKEFVAPPAEAQPQS
ncbi:hypothetical protein [Hymenobacter fodinae]|uniref:hypothetical protein n=1 Tax=Hymenobacter fodinae TaxID=2510796 RepID=UPI001AEC2058|nr:hypothetical protein [Hymenobacter fodinae]